MNNDRLYRDIQGGGHIMGTTRMGTSRTASVVDANCRVHGYDNFFVAGSSVFPDRRRLCQPDADDRRAGATAGDTVARRY